MGSEQGLSEILWEDDDPRRVRIVGAMQDDDDSTRRRPELAEYFAGERQRCERELDFVGTPFHKQSVVRSATNSVWTNTDIRRDRGFARATEGITSSRRRKREESDRDHRTVSSSHGANGELTGSEPFPPFC